MPYPADHKAKVRRRIVRSARNLFNSKGYATVSIDEVMAAAGLTRGGFYSHFRNKADLYREAIGIVIEEHPAREWKGVDFDMTSGNLGEKIIDAYLSDAHLADMERSCPLVTQSADAARGGPEIRETYLAVLEAMTRAIRKSIKGSESEAARDHALAIAGLCVGGLSLARAVDDASMAEDIRRACHATARAMLAHPPAG